MNPISCPSGVAPIATLSEWMPLAVYLDLKGVTRRAVSARHDIKRRKVRGRVEIHRSALDVTFRGGAR